MAIYRIRSYHGGLGDELQFSTFPEYLTELGHEVYLLIDSTEVQPFRNEGIKEFIYGNNPFIKGEFTGKWDIGDNLVYENSQDDFIKNWEKLFSLEPQNSLPKIYYKPNKLVGIDGLIELSAISFKYDSDIVIKKVQELIKGKEFVQLVSTHQSNPIIVPHVPIIEVANLNELSDCIFSCNTFISLSSGSHSLAAAIRRKTEIKQVCFLPSEKYDATMERKLFIYPGVEYLKA